MKKLLFLTLVSTFLFLTACRNNYTPLSDASNKDTNTPKISRTADYENIIKYPASGNFSAKEDIRDSGEKQTDSNSNKELIGTYSSKVYTKTEDRQKNLKIVCEKLSGTILKPNEEFSYNEVCGPYNKENGFGKATVFLSDGTEKQDYGGGVCQLSSTLYNAIKGLNVEITERHNHSKKVYYVPEGDDATVSYGNLDFKFKNLSDNSWLFEATSNSEVVNVNIYKI